MKTNEKSLLRREDNKGTAFKKSEDVDREVSKKLKVTIRREKYTVLIELKFMSCYFEIKTLRRICQTHNTLIITKSRHERAELFSTIHMKIFIEKTD